MINDAIVEFSKKAIHRPGVDLYRMDDAIELIRLCEKHNISVLGIDSFTIYDNKIQPSLENSIDLSNENDCYTLALEFLTKIENTDFVYEIVY